MAINPGQVGGRINGFPCTDPAFGLEAYWIEAVERERAQELGYTVVDASIVVTTHFNQLLHNHADELLGRNEVGQLLDNLAKDSPKLVEEVVPKLVPVAVLQKVLRYLLAEGLHIRDLRSVVEVLSENAGKTQDPIELTTQVRLAMARSIVQQLWPQDGEVQVLVFEPNLERLLGQALQTPDASLEPGLAEMLLVQLRAAAAQREAQGQSAVLLVPPALRWPLAQLLRRAASSLRVLAQNEIPDNRQVRVAATIGGKG
jgi:flagellar biosynthesis protein FlhA